MSGSLTHCTTPLVLSLSKDDNPPSRFDKLTMSELLTGCAIPLVLSLSKDDERERLA